MEFLKDLLAPTPAVLAALVAVVLWHVLKTEKMVEQIRGRKEKEWER